ncbi:TATA box-binding protein-associated factor RNA polymerase I subunit A [Erpetoichthys calabaricus]|uniref:TATA box-binding protein-associated factor RNA polymerase I subunit A n=1 Tax=Erpetoichthys calabaricus TaxID=27687 RepID=UPI002233F898|nr:TATA box-binding protein-associated factor RNA polymerase I subunit A [Erpetoichthys calabaricus]XP_028676458.2 TATA box-binding protein-associated factor RNA polymerase I subunit A [Erpetoichthys calabaricus]
MDDISNEFTIIDEGTDEGADDSEDAHSASSFNVSSLRRPTRKKRETDIRKTTRTCLDELHDALLRHQWTKAAEFMQNYIQVLEDSCSQQKMHSSQRVWRMGAEILRHHPDATVEDFNSFYDRMKHLQMSNYLKVSLEHAFYLISKDKIDDAKRQLSLAESWRYGKFSASQEKITKLIQAYHGLLDFSIWITKRNQLVENGSHDFADAASNQEMHTYFRQASSKFHEVIKQPGVWDPFVLCFVKLLEFYDDYNGAVQVLNNYAYADGFPANPNAQIYLYKFLKKNNADVKKLVKVLRVLHILVPSHKLMLKFCSLLDGLDKTKYQQESLKILFDLLDYSDWKDYHKVWKRLEKKISLVIKLGYSEWIKEQWESRKDWWPAFHFSTYQAKRNVSDNLNFACRKATIAGFLLSKKCRYFKVVYKEGMKANPKLMKKMKKRIEKSSIASQS